MIESKFPFVVPGSSNFTATPQDEELLAFIGGGVTAHGVAYTGDQLRYLKKFYGFDPKATERRIEEGYAEAQRRYLNALEQCRLEREKNPRNADRIKDPEPPKRDNTNNIGAFFDAGDEINLFKYVSREGMRIMAFLARFLQKGEDPVKLVAKLCAEAGYDVDGATVEWAESIDSEDA